jgi:hypothetical protein
MKFLSAQKSNESTSVVHLLTARMECIAIHIVL